MDNGNVGVGFRVALDRSEKGMCEMTIFASIRRVLSNSKRRNVARDAKRLRLLQEANRRRIFEALETREMLDGTGFNVLPEVITIANPDSYHYAIVGTNCDLLDTSAVAGLDATLLSDTQVAFTVVKKSATDGAVTTLGEVVLQLFSDENEAQNSSNHFLDVVDSGYYEGKSIHRIMAGFMFQGGSLDGAGHGGSGNNIPDEHSPLLSFSRAGTVAYANSGSGTSDAQFFVTFGAPTYLNNGYNIFGYVVDGYDVVAALQEAEVVNNGAGEQSKPVDSYTTTNFHVLEADEQTHSILRLTASDSANGKTALSYTTAESETPTATTVYVGQTGLTEYIKDALNSPFSETVTMEDGSEVEVTYNSFECVAGEQMYGVLPTTFGDKAVRYTITANEDAEGITITPANTASNLFRIDTTATSPQKVTLTITATCTYTSGYNGTSATGLTPIAATLTTEVTRDVLVHPATPTATFVADEAFKVDDAWIIHSDFINPEINLQITTGASEGIDLNQRPYLIALDGQTVNYTVVPQSGSAEDTAQTRSVTLNLDEPLTNGAHYLTVQRRMPTEDGTDLLSGATRLDFTVELNDVDFTNDFSALTSLKEGVAGSLQLTTNRVDSEGAARSDVKFELVANDANPSFISVSETGTLTWTAPTASQVGRFTIQLKATDGGGSTTTEDVNVYVDGKPVLQSLTLDEVSGSTDEVYSATIKATDPNNSADRIVYELVSGPEGMSITAAGAITWNLPEAYPDGFDADTTSRPFTFTVKATKQTVVDPEAEELEYVDGLSAERAYTVEILNKKSDDTELVTPTVAEVPAQTVKTGQTLETPAISATLPSEGAEGYAVEYKLNGVEGTDYPTGMTIDAATGKLTWAVPSAYLTDGGAANLAVKVDARAYTQTEGVKSYSGSATTNVTITVEQGEETPTPTPSEIDSWDKWVDAWVTATRGADALKQASLVEYITTKATTWPELIAARTAIEQARNDAHAQNLAEYMTEYVKMIDERDQKLRASKSKDEFDATAQEYDAKLAADPTYDDTLSAEDKLVSDAYATVLAALGDAQKSLDSSAVPSNADEQLKKAADKIDASPAKTEKSNSNFRVISKTTGAQVETTLSDILKVWRNGYSRYSVYQEIYADIDFNKSISDDSGSGSGSGSSTDSGSGSGSGSGSSTDSGSGSGSGSGSSTDSGSGSGSGSGSSTDSGSGSGSGSGSSTDSGSGSGSGSGSSTDSGSSSENTDSGSTSNALLDLAFAEEYGVDEYAHKARLSAYIPAAQDNDREDEEIFFGF